MGNRLTWSRTEYNEVGKAGLIVLFSINYRVISTDLKYYLVTRLPGFDRNKKWADDDPDALKKAAENILGKWLREVGA